MVMSVMKIIVISFLLTGCVNVNKTFVIDGELNLSMVCDIGGEAF